MYEVRLKDSAIILTSGMFNSRNAKTAFGLVRHSETVSYTHLTLPTILLV